MTPRKFSFLCAVVAFVSMAGCSKTGHDPLNPWNISDNDSVYLHPPDMEQMTKISGALFKAINPRFIANVYGITEYDDFSREQKLFELITFDHSRSPNYDDQTPLTSLNVRKKWNYCINDEYADWYPRVLISAFLLQAFERVEYIESDSTGKLLAFGMPLGVDPKDIPPNEHPYEMISLDGTIKVYTRDTSKSVINDRTTLYLINNQVVTRKIYEAINPVYMRSLKRITDQPELAKYKQKKNIKEVVEVELFTYKELTKNNTSNGGMTRRIVECPECRVYIVDNVQVDMNVYDALRRIFFRKVQVIEEDNKEAFEPYRKLFPVKDLSGWRRSVRIISL